MSMSPQGYIASKIMTASGLVVSILIAFISLFVIFNFNSITNRFGFESKESLRSKLNKSQIDLNKTIEINQELADTNDMLAKENNSLAESCTRFIKEESVKSDKINVKTQKYNAMRAEVKKKHVAKKTVTPAQSSDVQSGRIVTNEETMRTEISRINITQLHDSYNTLFQQS